MDSASRTNTFSATNILANAFRRVLQGIVLGLLTSLVALGIVLVYRSNRVLNFAQGELGLLPTILSVMLIVESGFPYLVALLLGLLAAITLGVSSEFLVIRRFTGAHGLC